MLPRRSSLYKQPPPEKTNRNDENERKKIFPIFIEFLETEIWKMSIAHFMELNSIVFDREQGDCNVYKKIYEQFFSMVDSLIDSFCQDSKIKKPTLVKALATLTKGSNLLYKEKILLEPIIAAKDYNVFVPMMMRNNIELQLQALKMLENLKDLPSSLTLDKDDSALWEILFNEDESERLILISVLKQSKAEWEREEQMNKEQWQRQLEEALQNSLLEQQTLVNMRKAEQKLLDNAININMTIKDNLKPSTSKLNNNSSNQLENGANTNVSEVNKLSADSEELNNDKKYQINDQSKGSQKIENVEIVKALGNICGAIPQHKENLTTSEDYRAKQNPNSFGYRSLLKKKDDVSKDEIDSRANYLREQRDKLLEKKRKERVRQLAEVTNAAINNRPNTAKTVQNTLSNSYNEIERRRIIVAKLKANLIDNFTNKNSLNNL